MPNPQEARILRVLSFIHDNQVAGVASNSGYANPGSFAHAFTGHYGRSPDAFRKAGRILPPQPLPAMIAPSGAVL